MHCSSREIRNGTAGFTTTGIGRADRSTLCVTSAVVVIIARGSDWLTG